ncbi:hypothetical protein BKA69DRAFT_505505 [Paraphysoderma sedebokerense]|nr:hypothetical protein BKA69DRAFT_505505 [Paraphysoderma sedebokerense]
MGVSKVVNMIALGTALGSAYGGYLLGTKITKDVVSTKSISFVIADTVHSTTSCVLGWNWIHRRLHWYTAVLQSTRSEICR